jgi:hypothetical protein
MRRITAIVIYIIISITVQGQNIGYNSIPPNTSKAIIYFSGSQYLPFAYGIGISANIELPVLQSKMFLLYLKGSAGVGYYYLNLYDMGDNLAFGTFSTVFIVGKGRSKFELITGIGKGSKEDHMKDNSSNLIPTIGIGGRFYRDEYFVRGGIGYPETVYVSYGWYF